MPPNYSTSRFTEVEAILINVIKENRSSQEQRYKNNRDFKIFFEEYDRRRNTDFVKTFPEMAEWYRNII